MKNNDLPLDAPPPDRANFNPRAFIQTNMVDTHKKMFHPKHLSSSSLGFFLKEDFLSFYYTYIVKNNGTPGAGQILTPGLLFEQTLKTPIRTCFMLNFLALALWVLKKKIF
jgi:hypothetical protein